MSSEEDISRDTGTDEEGKFKFDGLPKGRYEITCGKDDYISEKVKAKTGDASSKVVLKKNGEIKGKVVSESDGSPLKEFSIRVSVSPSGNYDPLEDGGVSVEGFEDRDDGSFEIDNLSEKDYEIRIETSEFAPKTIDGIRANAEETTDLGTIKLNKGVSLKVHVLSEQENAPIEKAEVGLRECMDASDFDFLHDDMISGSETDADGVCLLKYLPHGKKSLRVEKENFITKTETVDLSGSDDKEVTVTLRRGNTFHVHVFSAETEEPLQFASIGFSTPNDRLFECPTGETDENGYCVLKCVPPEANKIYVYHKDYLRAKQDIEAPQSGEGNLTIKLSKGITFKGIVLSKIDNLPIGNAQVTSSPTSIQAVLYGFSDKSALTDASGIFKIENLVPGENEITIQHEDFTPLTQTVKIEDGAALTTFHLTKGGSLLVRVKDSQGQPLPNIALQILDKGLHVRFWEPKITTNDKGEYLFEHLSKGNCHGFCNRG